MKKKVLTLALPVQEGKVLLGMKKRGFGMGKWNGFGGKVEAGESIEEATKRETFEECGIDIREMKEVGTHEFRFEDKPDEVLKVHVFRVTKFANDPSETEEMRPAWFVFHEIPFDSMWVDDHHWFPYFLEGKKFRGEFLFSSDAKKILSWNIREV